MKKFVGLLLYLLLLSCQEKEAPFLVPKKVELSITVGPIVDLPSGKDEHKDFSCQVSTNIPQIMDLCRILGILDTIKYNKTDEKVLYESDKIGWKKYKTFYRGISMERGSCDLEYSLVNKDIKGFMCYFSNDLEEKYITNPFKKIHPDRKHSFIKGTVMLDTHQIEVHTSIGNNDSKFFYKSPLYNTLHKQYFHESIF